MSKETVLNKNAFFKETDAKGIIRFANEDFVILQVILFLEMFGKPHNMVRHKDITKAAFKSLWDTVQKVRFGQDM